MGQRWCRRRPQHRKCFLTQDTSEDPPKHQTNEHTPSSLASRSTSTTTSQPAATRPQTLTATSSRKQHSQGCRTIYRPTRTERNTTEIAPLLGNTNTPSHGDRKVPPKLTDNSSNFHARPLPLLHHGVVRESRPRLPAPLSPGEPTHYSNLHSALRSPIPKLLFNRTDHRVRDMHAMQVIALPRGCSVFFAPVFSAGGRRWVLWVSFPLVGAEGVVW